MHKDETPSPTHGDDHRTADSEALAAAGEPGTLPPAYCRKCQAEVTPEGKGKCPRCGTFLRLNFVARRHPVNKLRRDALLAEFVRDYNPTTQLLRSTCEQLAGILEQLEVLKPGSPDHQRLVQLSQLLGDALEASRSSREARTPTDLGTLSDDALIERTTTILRGLLDLRDAKTQADALIVQAAVAVGGQRSDVEEITDASTAAEPAQPPPPCPYCRRSPCVGPEHSAFSVLHYDDPEEVKKRDEIATATMMKMVRYGNPY